MRQKRTKVYRKLMALYSMSFGFRQPYQVLVDAETCKSATTLKLELVKQLGIVLQGTVKPMITQCCIHELYLSGQSNQPAVDLAKTFERRKCNHRDPIPGDECLTDVVGGSNKHRYVVATQSQPLRVNLRSIPAVPIIHINRSVMVLEPPSDITIKTKERTEEQTLHPTAPDMALISSTDSAPPWKKRRGPKGPNPLSVKKRKKMLELAPATKNKVREKVKTFGDPAIFGEAKVGEKRKREEAGGKSEGPERDNDHQEKTDSEKRAGGHKRKRRRNATGDMAGNTIIAL